ncbi:MAG: hypothetical protein JOZ57_06955, partial [Abitibacteriaceae bacterium]|nr:hypothetical protein [Abditibacteriaceae bacterium]
MATATKSKAHHKHHKKSHEPASLKFPKVEHPFNWDSSTMRQVADPLADNVIAAINSGPDADVNTQQV